MTDCYRPGLSCEKINEFKTRQIDENRKISRRVDELEKYKSLIDSINNSRNDWLFGDNELVKMIQKLEEKIKTLSNELFFLKDNYAHPIEKMVKENINNIWNKINEIELNNSKKPHKCPVCNGNSKVQIMHGLMEPFEKRIIDSQGRHFILCHTCNGKGIIWG